MHQNVWGKTISLTIPDCCGRQEQANSPFLVSIWGINNLREGGSKQLLMQQTNKVTSCQTAVNKKFETPFSPRNGRLVFDGYFHKGNIHFKSIMKDDKSEENTQAEN